MDVFWSYEIDRILNKGHPLSDVGVRNWGLNKGMAIDALNIFKEHEIAVLGGDVYLIIENKISPTYDSWYCDTVIGESDLSYAMRSMEVARDYISNYPISNGSVLFAIVPKINGSI